jgi:serine protease Do
VTIAPLTPAIASQLGVNPGTAGMVITALNPLGAAAEAGLQAGDIIVSINHMPVHSEADVNAALAKSSKPGALFLIDRRGQNLFVMVNLG